MVIGVVSGYNEAPRIQACLESLRHSVNIIVYVDGAYADFPHETPFSSDGSLDVARDLAEIVVEAKRPWQDEVQKRNAYLLGCPDDWYLHIDGDEELEGTLDRQELGQGDDLDILLSRDDGSTSPGYWVYRAFKHRRGLHYFGTHHALWADGELLNKRTHGQINSVRILHHVVGTSEARMDAKAIYYKRLKEREKGFRSEHHL